MNTMATLELDDDMRFAAIRRRDAAFDGRFYYSVRTTGVYCRPSCAARPARAENVAFHATAAEAEAAGFRACKRCRPNAGGLAAAHAIAVAAAVALIESAQTPPSLERLAAAAGMSPTYFHRVFKSITGVTPKAYGEARRVERVAQTLREGARVTDAIYEAGYATSSRFYEHATRRLGMSPSRYRNGGAGMTIRFAVGETSLGAVIVAATDRGICAIALGDDADALVRDLQDRFPNADLIGGDTAFEALVARVIGVIEEPRQSLDLPLDIRGTAFQERVWNALRAIPAGKTASYREVATTIGAPGSARAVATACGANPLAVAIPCHRVVRIDGALSGYRWGVERKRELLARERAEREHRPCRPEGV